MESPSPLLRQSHGERQRRIDPAGEGHQLHGPKSPAEAIESAEPARASVADRRRWAAAYRSSSRAQVIKRTARESGVRFMALRQCDRETVEATTRRCDW